MCCTSIDGGIPLWRTEAELTVPFKSDENKNVLVHKFVCRGTMEERIDPLIT